jgi:uncharacterized membrane protein YgcG
MFHNQNIMKKNDLIPHIDALKDVVDIQIDENQNIITFGRVGREKFWKAVVVMAILVAIVSYIVMQQTVVAVIIGFVILAAAGWYLSENFRSVIVDLKRKRVSSSLFNIISDNYQYEDYRGPLVYMMTLNGREPSPKEFCLKFRRKDRIQEIHLADLTKGKNSTPKENLKHISELWNLIEENFQLDEDYDTEYQMSARNAIFV